MTAFQFDKCFDDKKVIKKCNDEGHATALRLPRNLRDAEDPELLKVFMPGRHAMVTTDRALPTQHTAHIPDTNPGIVVVCYSRDVLKTITTGAAAKILDQLKSSLSTWHQTSVANSIVEITEQSVEVFHVEAGKLIQDTYLDFKKESDWPVQFLNTLQKNVLRQAGLPAPPPSDDAERG